MVVLLSLSAIATFAPAASASVLTGKNPAIGGVGGASKNPSPGGPTVSCNNPSSITDLGYVLSTFALCTTDTTHEQSGTDGDTICPSGFDVWRFYSESTSPGTVSGYTVSRAYQNMSNCQPVDGQFTVPNHADAAPGDVASNAFDTIAGTQFPVPAGAVGTPAGNTVYDSTIDPSDITTYKTFAQVGSSCTNLMEPSGTNEAVGQAIFAAMAKGDATAAQTTFAQDYWADYQSEGTGEARNYLMNLPEATPSMSSPNWSLLASSYGEVTGGSPCSSAYQFIPVSTTQDPNPATGVEGVCIMPVAVNTEEWVDETLTTGNKTVSFYNQLNNTLGGDRYVAQNGTNSTSPGSAAVSSTFFSTWRNAISSEVTSRNSVTQPYVGAPYINPVDLPAPWASSQDRTLAASTASQDATCIGFTSKISALNAPTGTTTTTTTTTPGGGTPTTTTTQLQGGGGPGETITPSAPTLTAGGSLNPNQVSIAISPFNTTGLDLSGGKYPVIPLALTVNATIKVAGGYSNFWFSGQQANQAQASGDGSYTLTIPTITATGTHDYEVDFAYATKPSQPVTFAITPTPTQLYETWKPTPVTTCTTTTTPATKATKTTKAQPAKTTTTCKTVTTYVPEVLTYYPTVTRDVVTKVVGGAVTPSN
jgi:hypothetical protein